VIAVTACSNSINEGLIIYHIDIAGLFYFFRPALFPVLSGMPIAFFQRSAYFLPSLRVGPNTARSVEWQRGG
jgi:hypothetical protein